MKDLVKKYCIYIMVSLVILTNPISPFNDFDLPVPKIEVFVNPYNN